MKSFTRLKYGKNLFASFCIDIVRNSFLQFIVFSGRGSFILLLFLPSHQFCNRNMGVFSAFNHVLKLLLYNIKSFV